MHRLTEEHERDHVHQRPSPIHRPRDPIDDAGCVKPLQQSLHISKAEGPDAGRSQVSRCSTYGKSVTPRRTFYSVIEKGWRFRGRLQASFRSPGSLTLSQCPFPGKSCWFIAIDRPITAWHTGS
jgi:hypothetical protein